MRAVIACCSAPLLIACSKPQNQQVRSPATTPTVTLSSFAGTWQVRASNEAGDSVLAYQIVATGDPSGWKTLLPNRPPIPANSVTISGDSAVTEQGPFESALRKGVQVRTHGVLRLQGDRLVGYTIAHYATKSADSVVRLNIQGTKQP